LIFFKHRARNQYLITIFPAADRFIFNIAKEEGVNLSDFDLPTEFEDFLKETKTITSNKDQRFKKLFKEIKNHKEISLLQKVLTYLCENKYQSDVEEIKKF
jgi:F0F1-type ATP synthase delta subunit